MCRHQPAYGSQITAASIRTQAFFMIRQASRQRSWHSSCFIDGSSSPGRRDKAQPKESLVPPPHLFCREEIKIDQERVDGWPLRLPLCCFFLAQRDSRQK